MLIVRGELEQCRLKPGLVGVIRAAPVACRAARDRPDLGTCRTAPRRPPTRRCPAEEGDLGSQGPATGGRNQPELLALPRRGLEVAGGVGGRRPPASVTNPPMPSISSGSGRSPRSGCAETATRPPTTSRMASTLASQVAAWSTAAVLSRFTCQVFSRWNQAWL